MWKNIVFGSKFKLSKSPGQIDSINGGLPHCGAVWSVDGPQGPEAPAGAVSDWITPVTALLFSHLDPPGAKPVAPHVLD